MSENKKDMTRITLNKKIIAALVLLPLSLSVTRAQENEPERDLDRRVEVSREYMPDMDRAAKLTIQPVMNDTVSLRPELEYTIAPSPWMTGFGVAAIRPVRVDAATFDPLQPFYLKAGVGVPFRTILDVYGTTTSTGGGYAGGYINHNGRWSDLKNDMGVKGRALDSHNSLGVFGRAYLGRRIALSAEVGYDYDVFSRYGYVLDAQEVPSKNALMSYSMPRATINIGNDFTDMSFFNFNVGADGYMLKDRQQAKETGFKLDLALGKRFGVHELMLSGKYEGFFGSDALDGYDMNMFGIKPSYAAKGRRVEFGAAVEILNAKMKNADGKTYFLPSAEARLMFDGAFGVFAGLESTTVSNSYRSVTSRNPYMLAAPWTGYGHITRDYKALAGVRGDISSHFAYEVRAGGGIVKDPHYMIYSYYTDGFFAPLQGNKYKYFTAGLSLTGKVSETFRAVLEMDYHNYSTPKELSHVPDVPEFKADLSLNYNHRDKLLLGLRGVLTGSRYHGYYNAANQTDINGLAIPDFDKQKGVFDLGIDAQYRLNPKLSVWLSGENLLNSKLYPYYRYRGFGISVTAGVKLMF